MEELQAMAILINKYQLSAKIIPYHEQQRVGRKKAYRMRLSGGVAWRASIGFREISVKSFRGIVSTDLYKSPVHLDLRGYTAKSVRAMEVLYVSYPARAFVSALLERHFS